MKGLQILLQSFGVNIKPEDIESAWERSKDALPQLATAFQEMNARYQMMSQETALMREQLKTVDEKLNTILALTLAPMVEGSENQVIESTVDGAYHG